ncbi:elongation factor-1 alpha [Thalassotalea sp. Y01]|uniref:elongation factor-1 alpha n=1 Tax=Thalassotalea sp. Y01 TaxID=2729613 RepID=UPI00145EBC5C|nr:elongation factor-1 alpha [Thalassotalea sp. Y01]NMP15100.1 elongation factor-1 alpha [Thalassotalea sp. Y01]
MINTDSTKATQTVLNLPSIALGLKALFTGYLLVIGIGLMVAGGQILLTHGMADGKFGLSVDDIVYSYYGDRKSSKLENKLNGSMQDKAERVVRQDIIKWVREGASETQWDNKIAAHFANNCTQCHGVIPGLPDFNQYQGVLPVAQVDNGASIDSLTRVSHIHLFGIAFIFFFVGLIFSLAVGIANWLKVVAISTPFAFLIIDVLSWWLTKINPHFAWLTIIGGVGYTIASAYMWCVSMQQMWWRSNSNPNRHQPAW